ncbi:MAG TPA: tRNA uridine-5-carboxymethylaminomethyl(34) synthesis GTPase MnmE, partial [Kiritimatiellae bacterium]|nr:tRNA uridine-5-carboxymethylaminomethyl(34) synthesis GTPase MnmE [Kiritimatiellia bacterium]
ATATLGTLQSPASGPLDRCLAIPFHAPHSYTGEDLVEFHCHGGTVVPQLALRALLEAGACLAGPGEFTRRAFLNGKIDLTQAESVADLVTATTHQAAKLALHQLSGDLSSSLSKCYDNVLTAAAAFEAALDFPDEDLPTAQLQSAASRVSAARDLVTKLLSTYAYGRALRRGLLVTIAGPSNVGKSTLLNRLLGRDRAIVTSIPGTTRDTIEETLTVDGIALRIVDTAGLRPTGCPIESEGIRRAEQYINSADILLLLVAADTPPPADTLPRVRDLIKRDHCVTVINKTDLGRHPYIDDLAPDGIPTCLLHDEGHMVILHAIRRHIQSLAPHDPSIEVAISERHNQHLTRASSELDSALRLLQDPAFLPENTLLIAEHLHAAADQIAQITGRSWTDDMLDRIFSSFCIGK